MYALQFTEPAEYDLLAILQYISNVLKAPSAAYKLLNEIEDKVKVLQTNPRCTELVSDEYVAAKGIRALLVKNYYVFYRIKEKEKTISIIRILYARRDWASLLKESPKDDIPPD